MHELILGGQKSGKSRRAEDAARQWLASAPQHRAVLIATALGADEEMRQRIQRHRIDRAQRLPQLLTVQEPLALAQAIATHSQPDTLVVVDCLTLWLTNCLMPVQAPIYMENKALAHEGIAQTAMLMIAIEQAKGPLVMVSNEIGQGVIPLGPQVREFVDALGLLHQQIAQRCGQVTLMVAGLPLHLKAGA